MKNNNNISRYIAGLIIAVTGMFFAYELYQYALNENSKLINDLRKANLILPLLPALLISSLSLLTAYFLINTPQEKIISNTHYTIEKIKGKQDSDRKQDFKLGLTEIISIIFTIIGIIIGIIYITNKK